MSNHSFTQGDLEHELNNLHCLLEQATWMMAGLQHNGDREQEIADAIVCVARNIAGNLCGQVAAMAARRSA